MNINITVTVEAKDEFSGPDGNWQAGALPEPEEAVSRLRDIILDITKRDGIIGWRVTGIEEQ